MDRSLRRLRFFYLGHLVLSLCKLIKCPDGKNCFNTRYAGPLALGMIIIISFCTTGPTLAALCVCLISYYVFWNLNICVSERNCTDHNGSNSMAKVWTFITFYSKEGTTLMALALWPLTIIDSKKMFCKMQQSKKKLMM